MPPLDARCVRGKGSSSARARDLRLYNRKLWRPTDAKNHVRTVSNPILFRHVYISFDSFFSRSGINIAFDADAVIVGESVRLFPASWSGSENMVRKDGFLL